MFAVRLSCRSSSALTQPSPLSLHIRPQLFLPPCVAEVMKLSDAKHYRAEAKKCRDAAASAEDSAARLHWQHAERCWLTLAN
jgi:hypothetical protein